MSLRLASGFRRGPGPLLALAGSCSIVAGCGTQALQTSHPPRTVSPAVSATVVFDCGGGAQVKPRTLVLACADAGDTLVRLRWRSWGEASATARGALSELTCVPNCAAGGIRLYQVTVRVTGLALQGSRAAYRQLTVTAEGGTLGGLGRNVRYSLTATGPAIET